MNQATLDRHLEQQLESLHREFDGELPAGRVAAVCSACLERLRADARILDYIPVLVYRFAREELVRCTHESEQHAAEPLAGTNAI